MKSKNFLAGVVVGVVIGVALCFLYSSHTDQFNISIMNIKTAVKINKRTGETWTLIRTNQSLDPGVWVQTTNSN
jgi:gas vesicle protein